MTKRRLILMSLLCLLLAGLYTGIQYRTHHAMIGRMQDSLAAYGLNQAVIGAFAFSKDRAVYTDITLDPDKFSSIKAISIGMSYLDALLGRPAHAIIIDDIRLTADYSRNKGLDVSGWTNKTLPFPAYDQITLNGGQIDIDTKAGGLRFQTKGLGQKQPDGSLKIQASAWGIQNQVKAESSWEAVLYPDGRWAADVDLQNGGLNLDTIQASRAAGWLTIDKTKSLIPAVSGQIDAGKVTIGKINFMNFSLTVNGPANLYKLIARGDVAEYRGMTATLDVDNTPLEPRIQAVIETPDLDDLISFMADLQSTKPLTGPLTPLLLTSGNLKRLHQEIERQSYDTLELEIAGPLYDLAGKVILKKMKDGVMQKQVISLDPGTDGDNG